MGPLPKIFAGGPARETSSLVFQAHRAGLDAQSDGFELEIRHKIVTDPGGHRWQQDKIERVADARQTFLVEAKAAWLCSLCGHDGRHPHHDYAGRCHESRCGCVWNADLGPNVQDPPRKYAALFMVDSDVILGPGVLARMWAVDAPVVFGTYWTYADWGGAMDHYPQCWDVHPYRFTPDCWAALKAEGVNEVPVLGGGACTLIRGRGFESRYWPLLQSLRHAGGIWPGEDRTYCLGLEARGIPMVAVTGLPIHHCYTIADSTRPALARIREKIGLQPKEVAQ